MPTNLPVATVVAGTIYTPTLYNNYLAANINKLLNTGHRVLTVAQFNALTGLEGTKGTVAPDEVYLEVDSTNGVQWHLAYESGEATYKWRFLGGPPMVSEVTTSEGTASTTYAALTTAGPSIAVPRAGDFDVALSVTVSNNTNSTQTYMSYDIGGTGAVDADAVELDGNSGISGAFFALFRTRRKAALTAITLTSKYKIVVASTGSFKNREMRVTPVRLV